MANMNIESMLEKMDLPQVETKVIKLNNSKRLPVIILIDASESMSEYEELLKHSVEGLYDMILRDPKLANATELALLTFNSDIEILERMREIKTQETRGRNLNFHCSGATLTGLALKTAILQLEARKKVYMESTPRIKYYAPILFLVSDGKPDCDDTAVQVHEDEAMRFSMDYIKKEVAANNLVVFSVEVGDHCNHRLMQELTGLRTDKHIAKINTAAELSTFYRVATSLPFQGVRLSAADLNSVPFSEM